MSPLWAVQSNLDAPRDARKLLEACKTLGHAAVEFVGVHGQLPAVPVADAVLFYGSTHVVRDVVRSARWKPGAYFDEAAFRHSEYQRRYGSRALNASAELTTVREFADRRLSPKRQFFLRPDDDFKSFPGDVLPFGTFAEWANRLEAAGRTDTLDTRIIVAEPVDVEHEWRTFIVDGRVSSGSHYRFLGDLEVSPEVPSDVKAFAADLARVWSPVRAFAMDIARSAGELLLVELNGINSSGFYAADVVRIVDDVCSGLTSG